MGINWKLALQVIGVLATLGTLIGLASQAFWFMDARHSQVGETLELRKKLLETEASIRASYLEDAKNDVNERRQFYDDLNADGIELTPAQKRRKMQLEERSEDLEKEEERWTKLKDDLRE